MAPCKRRSDTDRRAFADEHLLYELWMLGRLPDLLAELELAKERVPGAQDEAGDPMWNALVESFAIHTRVLIDFFFLSAPQKAADAVALDYFHDDPSKWPIPEKTAELRAVKDQVGQQIVHASYNRLKVTEETKHWPFAKIRDDLAQVAAKFVAVVEDRRVGADFKQRTNAVLSVNPQLGSLLNVPGARYGGGATQGLFRPSGGD